MAHAPKIIIAEGYAYERKEKKDKPELKITGVVPYHVESASFLRLTFDRIPAQEFKPGMMVLIHIMEDPK